MKSYTIHLIRHGVCEGNLEGRYIGRTQSPLAQEGIQALLELKRKGIYPEAKKYYASPCVRCVDTLKVLYPTADPEVILELAECDFGDWENKKYDADRLCQNPKSAYAAGNQTGRQGKNQGKSKGIHPGAAKKSAGGNGKTGRYAPQTGTEKAGYGTVGDFPLMEIGRRIAFGCI